MCKYVCTYIIIFDKISHQLNQQNESILQPKQMMYRVRITKKMLTTVSLHCVYNNCVLNFICKKYPLNMHYSIHLWTTSKEYIQENLLRQNISLFSNVNLLQYTRSANIPNPTQILYSGHLRNISHVTRAR